MLFWPLTLIFPFNFTPKSIPPLLYFNPLCLRGGVFSCSPELASCVSESSNCYCPFDAISSLFKVCVDMIESFPKGVLLCVMFVKNPLIFAVAPSKDDVTETSFWFRF